MPIPATSTTLSAVMMVATRPFVCIEARVNNVTAAMVPTVSSWTCKGDNLPPKKSFRKIINAIATAAMLAAPSRSVSIHP